MRKRLPVGRRTSNNLLNNVVKLTLFLILLRIVIASSPPEFGNVYHLGVFNGTQDVRFTYFINASDADGDYPLNFTYSNTDNLSTFSMINYNDTHALINFTPPNEDVGYFQMLFTVYDSRPDVPSSIIVYFNISNVNDPPNITLHYPSSASADALENSSGVRFNYTATDPDTIFGDLLSSKWILDGIINAQNSTNFTYAPTLCDAGIHNLTINVSDIEGLYTTFNWTVTVTNVNRPPIFNNSKTIPNATWFEDNDLLDNITLSDYFYDYDTIECTGANKDVLSYTATGNINITIVINQTTTNVSYFPLGNWSGNETIIFRINDSYTTAPGNSILLNVINVNDPPLLHITMNKTWAVGHQYTEQLNATDPDSSYGDYLTFRYVLNDTFPNFSMNSVGFINFTPGIADLGNHTINITVNDSSGLIDSAIRFFMIMVNSPPIITPIPYMNGTENSFFNMTVYASDANNDNLTFSTNYSAFTIYKYNITSSAMYFTPRNADTGNHTINVTVNDTYGDADSTIFNLYIVDINNPPVLNNITSPQIAKINQNYLFYINATDADNDTLDFTQNSTLFNFTAVGSQSVLINFTPLGSQSGNYSINISAADTASGMDYKVFNMTITSNRPPVIVEINNQSAFTGINYSINITADDPDFDPVIITSNYSRFDSTRINSTTWNFYFTPLVFDISNQTIFILANDSDTGYDNMTFVLNITKLNHAPYFGGVSNVTCNWNVTCRFNITASDIDGDTIALNATPDIFTVNLTNTSQTSWLGRFNFTNTNMSVTSYSVTAVANDTNLTNSTSFYINMNYPPQINFYAPNETNFTINESIIILFNETTTDPEGGYLNYSWMVAGENSSVISACGAYGTNQTSCSADLRCTWSSTLSACTPINRYLPYVETATTENYTFATDYTSAGDYSVVFAAKDNNFANSTIYWNVTVVNINRPPVYGMKIHSDYDDFSSGVFNVTNITSEGYIRLAPNNTNFMESGDYISPIIDLADASDELYFTTISWAGNISNATNAFFQTRTSADTGMNSSWSNYTDTSDSNIASTPSRYLQYKITMNTSNVSITPNISQVVIGYTISNKTLNNKVVLLNWVDLDDYFYDVDTNDVINISVSGNTNINVEIDQSTRKVNLRPLNNFIGSEDIMFTFNDSFASAYSNYIKITYIENSSDSTSPSPLSSGGGGGGGGGVSIQTETKSSDSGKKFIGFKLLQPGTPVYYENGTVMSVVRVFNGANETLSGIHLSASASLPGVAPLLSKDYIETLDTGEEDKFWVMVDTSTISGAFDIILNGTVDNPVLFDSATIYMSTLQKGQVNKTQINTKIDFVRDLLNQNPECLELNEVLQRASDYVKTGDYAKASQSIDSVIESCKYLIARAEKPAQQKTIIDVWKKEINDLIKSPTAYLTLISLIVSSLLIFGYYLWKKPKSPLQLNSDTKIE